MKLSLATVVTLSGMFVMPAAREAAGAEPRQFTPILAHTLDVNTRHVIAFDDTTPVSSSNAPSVTVSSNDRGLVLLISNIYNGRLERERGIEFWESLSASNIVKTYADAGFALLPHEQHGQYQIDNEQLPLTVYLFGNGLLQVSEVIPRPSPRVKIRYKLVSRPPAAAP